MKLLYCLAFLFPLFLSGQLPALTHQHNFGGVHVDELAYYSGGPGSQSRWLFGHSASGNTGNHTGGTYDNYDTWLIRLDEQLNPVFQASYGGNDQDRGDFCIVAEDYLLLSSTSGSGISGNKTVPCFGPLDLWVLKTDTLGNILWQQNYGGNGTDACLSVTTCSDSSFVACVNSNSGISGNKTTPLIGATDIWLIEIALSDGHIIRQKSLGTERDESSWQILQLAGNHLLVVATALQGVGGDKTDPGFGLPENSDDVWLIELDQDWNVLRNKCFGGDLPEQAPFVTLIGSDLYLAVNTYSTPSGTIVNPTFTSGGYADIWVARIDAGWNIVWEKTFGGNDREFTGRITPLSGDKLVFSCTSISSPNNGGPPHLGNKTTSLFGGSDIWAVLLNQSGDEFLQLAYGSTDYEFGVFKPFGNDVLILSAESEGGISGNKTVGTYGIYDTWIGLADFGSILSAGSSNVLPLTVYPNPFENELIVGNVDLARYAVTLTDAMGRIQPVRILDQHLITEGLADGMYVLSVFDRQSGQCVTRRNLMCSR